MKERAWFGTILFIIFAIVLSSQVYNDFMKIRYMNEAGIATTATVVNVELGRYSSITVVEYNLEGNTQRAELSYGNRPMVGQTIQVLRNPNNNSDLMTLDKQPPWLMVLFTAGVWVLVLLMLAALLSPEKELFEDLREWPNKKGRN